MFIIIICFTFYLVFAMLLAACSQGNEQLTRVDVQIVDEEGNYEDVKTITDKKTIYLLKKSLEKENSRGILSLSKKDLSEVLS
ncbi:hypothetical protein ACLM5H_23385 [Fredinandcohnia humi]